MAEGPVIHHPKYRPVDRVVGSRALGVSGFSPSPLCGPAGSPLFCGNMLIAASRPGVSLGLVRSITRFVASLTVITGALILVGSAGAVPPVITSIGSQARHPFINFSAPRADDMYVTMASKPDRASDGAFLSENREFSDYMTDSEIQSGRWLDSSQLDPGTYFVLLNASPNFDLCYLSGGSYDPSCANGYSDMAKLIVPKPTIRYRAEVIRKSYLDSVSLRLVATPLGEKVPYRVCFTTVKKKRQCLAGTLDGYTWNSSADDELTVKTRLLSTFTTFTWTVQGKAVATKRVRVR